MAEPGEGRRKAKRLKGKLVPIVYPRRRRSIKKEASIKPTTEQNSIAFQELVEAAHKDAEWERGSGRPMPRRTSIKSAVAFGGSQGVGSQGDGKKLVWAASPLETKTKQEAKKEELDQYGNTDAHHDPFHPTMLPIDPRLRETPLDDTRKLLPQYVEERLADINSDDEEPSTAEALHLTENTDAFEAALFQLPSVLPVPGRKLEDGSSSTPGNFRSLEEGRIGKLFIYRSGKVKLKMGDVLFDVSDGTPWPFHQELVAINVREDDGHCVFLGNIKKRAVCTMNVNQLMAAKVDVSTEEPPNRKRKMAVPVEANGTDVMEAEEEEIKEEKERDADDRMDVDEGEKRRELSHLPLPFRAEIRRLKSADNKTTSTTSVS